MGKLGGVRTCEVGHAKPFGGDCPWCGWEEAEARETKLRAVVVEVEQLLANHAEPRLGGSIIIHSHGMNVTKLAEMIDALEGE
jgi:hypothetical protein